MALNLAMLKEPKYLIIGGIAVVGGIYFASKINKPKSASVEAPAPTIQTVASSDSLQQSDELQRSLSEQQDKYNEILAKQEAQQKEYAESIAGMQASQLSERDEFQKRLLEQQQQLGSQYGAQLSSLQGVIERLQAQLNAMFSSGKTNPDPTKPAPTNPNPGRDQVPTGPISIPGAPGPTPTAPTQPTADYPGVGPNYEITGGPQLSFDARYAIMIKNKMNSTFNYRNMFAFAMGGSGGPWPNRGDWNVPEAINFRRVHQGLRPLTRSEIKAMLEDVGYLASHYPEATQANRDAVRALYNKWNVPYQVSSVRRF